jgi:hypothetical protein
MQLGEIFCVILEGTHARKEEEYYAYSLSVG